MIASGQEQRVLLVAARQGDELVAAQLGQVLAGNVAVIWQPAFLRVDVGDDAALVKGLFTKILDGAAAGDVRLAQALTAVDDVHAHEQFAVGGFTRTAELIYLSGEVQGARAEEATLPFLLTEYHEGEEGRLARLVERTYEGTLDCPGLDGLRTTQDVLAGYRAVGQFRPELWRFVRWQEADVGCLLLNVHPDVRYAEIVYLALVPEVRGRGWGEALSRKACDLARDAACERVVLAVDAANGPAISMYERAGFFEFERREVWIAKLFDGRRK
jgi:ribosomal protein S18 acetylase RimI-like enzyme